MWTSKGGSWGEALNDLIDAIDTLQQGNQITVGFQDDPARLTLAGDDVGQEAQKLKNIPDTLLGVEQQGLAVERFARPHRRREVPAA